MLPFVAPTSCRRGTNYFTATPEGELKVEIAGCGVKIPVAGVMAYCDTVWELRLATNIQIPSLRIAIEFGPEPVATGVMAVKLPVVELIT